MAAGSIMRGGRTGAVGHHGGIGGVVGLVRAEADIGGDFPAQAGRGALDGCLCGGHAQQKGSHGQASYRKTGLSTPGTHSLFFGSLGFPGSGSKPAVALAVSPGKLDQA